MAIIIRRRPRRKPGERADLSMGKIAAAAFDVLEKAGLEEFSARLVAKRLGVSPAAIYAHFDGGLAGLKQALVFIILRDVARPYGPNDSPAGYLRDIFLRMLKAVNGKQALAELIALELSRDNLICPVFLERLLSASLGAGKLPPNPAQALDLVLASLLGMIMVEGETNAGDRIGQLSRSYIARVKALAPSEVPTLLATKSDLMLQIKRRMVPVEALLTKTALRYVEPVIAALKLERRATGPN
jgi:TetR/AcrR family transcriptional regulator, tetracycline repressor protein